MPDTTTFYGAGIEFNNIPSDQPIFSDKTVLKGFGIEFKQQGGDIRVSEKTTIKGFGIEFVDYPIYAFQILTRRL